MLRATIRQHHHEFPAALTDLEQVIRTDPNDAQAWLTRATILQVRGEYEEAKRSCVPLLRLAAPLLGTTCVSSAGSLSGAARKSSEVLARTLERSAERTAAVRRWALTVLAETAARLGDDQLARRHFSEALALGGRDEYLLGAYADFLLDHDQPEAVLSLLKGETPADALLLRVAIAEHRLGDPAFAAHRDLLRARFAANRQRGTPVHLREEARFTLECENDAARALPMAQENWSVQKEPWDARVLLEAAAATGARAAAQPVLDFLARWSVEDVSLSRLAAQLEPPRS
jgi:tetratricopeptide (TPR) repeat protein